MFDFYGRSGRLGYLGFSLLAWVILIGSLIVYAGFSGSDFEFDTSNDVAAVSLTSVAFIWVGLAASVRRCHDLGWHGVWLLLQLIPPAAVIQASGCWSRPATRARTSSAPSPPD